MSAGRQNTRNALVREAFVLKTTPFRERDLVVRAAIMDHGIIALLARGARGSKKRFAGALDPLTRVNLRFIPKEGGMGKLLESRVEQINTLDPQDLMGFFTRSFVAESLLVLVQEGHLTRFPYRLMTWVNEVFSETTNPDHARARAIWVLDRVRVILLHREGRLPDLELCTICQEQLVSAAMGVCFTAERGLICSRCSDQTAEFPGCGLSELKQVQDLFTGVAFTGANASAELRHWLTVLLRQTTGKILKSESMLEQFLQL